ncbi:MAG: sialidase, partial [bacterium]|nr:sialidase [bacterium]
LAEAWGCLPVKVPRKKGINRLVWDLRHGKSKKIKLRTPPPGAKHIRVGPKGWRDFPWGDEIPGPLAAPGLYTVKLTVGKNVYSQSLTIKKDPHSTGTLENIRQQLTVSFGVRKKMNAIAGIINKCELVRRQIYDKLALITKDKDVKDIINAAKALDKKIIAVEELLFSMGRTGEGD